VPTPRLTVDRYADEILAQAVLFRSHLQGADLAIAVPTCPGWNLAQLTQHLGAGFRWLADLVRTRATGPTDDTTMRVLDPAPTTDGRGRGEWLVVGAEELADALRAAGPSASMWTPLPDGRADFFARRYAHESLIHRADGALALGLDVAVDPDLALDGLAEWMELGGLPRMLEFHPERRDLLGPGRTLQVTATDTDHPDGAWFVDLTGDMMVHRPADRGESAAVELRGPLTELLLALYARRDLEAHGLETVGDRDLLEFWWKHSAFG
jgi:uncharacterized protein (TIGR03083 family)